MNHEWAYCYKLKESYSLLLPFYKLFSHQDRTLSVWTIQVLIWRVSYVSKRGSAGLDMMFGLSMRRIRPLVLLGILLKIFVALFVRGDSMHLLDWKINGPPAMPALKPGTLLRQGQSQLQVLAFLCYESLGWWWNRPFQNQPTQARNGLSTSIWCASARVGRRFARNKGGRGRW